MPEQHNIIERAFQIARSGSCKTVAEVRVALSRERYTLLDMMQIRGSLALQLQKICRAAKAGAS